MYYAVAVGRTVGVFKTWALCKQQVEGFEGAVFQKFASEQDANTFIRGKGSLILGQLGIVEHGFDASRARQSYKSEPQQSPQSPQSQQPPHSHLQCAIICFSDGSCFNNGSKTKNARAGYACVFPDYPKYTLAKTLHATLEAEHVTNNRAEYSALIAAIETCRRIDEDIGRKNTKLLFYTDSQLLINTATKWIQSWKNKGWRKADGERVLNLDLVAKIDELLKERRIEFKHVRAHTGGTDWMSTWNAKADELARAAAQGTEHDAMEK